MEQPAQVKVEQPAEVETLRQHTPAGHLQPGGAMESPHGRLVSLELQNFKR